jgi:uncharacterized linocin/CFP29 family protein
MHTFGNGNLIQNFDNPNAAYMALIGSSRPHGFKPMRIGNQTLFLPVRDARGTLAVNEQQIANNAFLAREEWELLDTTVYAMAQRTINAWADIAGNAALVMNGNLATMSSKWAVDSEMSAQADVHMRLAARREHDRTDKQFYSIPIPFISKGFDIDARELLSARQAGRDIDTTEATEATRVVVEQAESIIMNGITDPVVLGGTILGYRTLPARLTGTAASFGGGDFGTISNIRPTFRGVLSALSQNRYDGPFHCYVAKEQYWEMQARFSDGSGQTALETVEAFPEIIDVKKNDEVPDGEMVLVQPTKTVVDLFLALNLEVRQWEAVDGSAMHFLVIMAGAPRVKRDYDGNAGIAHVTAV